MKLILKTGAVLVLAWLLAGVPIPMIRVAPMKANPHAPVFDPDEVLIEREDAQENLESGSYTPDVDLQEMRSRIEDRFSSLQNDPCNDDLRKAFSKALAPYLKHKKKVFDRDEDGVPEERLLDQETIGILTVAIEEGYIGKADLPWAFRDMAPNNRSTACQRETAAEDENYESSDAAEEDAQEGYDADDERE